MTDTITIDTNTHTYCDGSLYVVEQQGLDVLEAVSWRAIDEERASFANAMRADYILIHDREVGIIIPRRTAHAWYRTEEGRHYDKFGNTIVTAPTRSLVERSHAPATLVNINFVSKPAYVRLPALPKLEFSNEAIIEALQGNAQLVG